MRYRRVLIPVGFVVLLAGCGPVEWLNSCFNEEDVVFDPALVGTWHDSDGQSTLRFQKSDDKAYKLLYTEVGAGNTEPQQSKYEVHLVRLGDFLFLDMVPAATQVKPGSYAFALAPSADEAGFQPHLAEVGDRLYASLVSGQQASDGSRKGPSYEVHLTQAHWVFRVWLDGDTLRLADLSEDWLTEALNQGKVDIRYEHVGDDLVVTASTQELRQFLLEHAGDEGAFRSLRKSGPASNEPRSAAARRRLGLCRSGWAGTEGCRKQRPQSSKTRRLCGSLTAPAGLREAISRLEFTPINLRLVTINSGVAIGPA